MSCRMDQNPIYYDVFYCPLIEYNAQLDATDSLNVPPKIRDSVADHSAQSDQTSVPNVTGNDTLIQDDNLNKTDESTGQSSTDNEDAKPDRKVPVIKTCGPPTQKDRFNYASFDCGAIIRQSDSSTQHATSILNANNKDTYMLTVCSDQNEERFVTIELCQDILIDGVVIANLEFFSSMYSRINVYISDFYPPVQWTHLAVLDTVNNRDLQLFQIEESVMWAKYVKLQFVGHYGSEHYCPLTLVKVYGSTMMEDLRNFELSQAKAPDSQSDIKLWSNPQFTSNAHHHHHLVSSLRSRGRLYHHPAGSNWHSQYQQQQNSYQQELSDLNKKYQIHSDQPSWQQQQQQQQSQVYQENGPQPQSSSTDSVFKSILKRLNKLEYNLNVTNNYLQNSIDVFRLELEHLEQDTRLRVEDYLERLGASVMTGMNEMRQDFDSSLHHMVTDGRQAISNLESFTATYQQQFYFNLCLIMLLSMVVGCLIYLVQTGQTVSDVLRRLRRRNGNESALNRRPMFALSNNELVMRQPFQTPDAWQQFLESNIHKIYVTTNGGDGDGGGGNIRKMRMRRFSFPSDINTRLRHSHHNRRSKRD
ncbi:hypothetical protein MIR68_002859 [Amoeboaphelidium protococcarum]|nr:hypothetical protein MIR68_002859 [Amoeboaphelidium protococcarum]